MAGLGPFQSERWKRAVFLLAKDLAKIVGEAGNFGFSGYGGEPHQPDAETRDGVGGDRRTPAHRTQSESCNVGWRFAKGQAVGFCPILKLRVRGAARYVQ